MLNKLFKYPLLNLILIIIITLLFIYGITKIKISTDLMEMLSKKNEVYMDDAKIKMIYNTGEVMFVGIKSKHGNILTVENLQTIDKITKKIEDIELPKKAKEKENKKEVEEDYSNLLENIEEGTTEQNGIQNDNQISNAQIFDSVDSITNIELIEGIDGGLAPVKFKKYIPANDKELKLFKEKLLSWDLFQDTIYSKDFSASSIMIIFAGDSKEDDQMAAYKEIKKIVDVSKNEDMEISYAGMPVVKTFISEYIVKDIIILIPLVTIVLVLVLYLSFRNIRGVFLPLLTVLISTIWVVGAMGFFGIKLTLIGTIIPVLLIAIGSAYGIHVITHYIEDKNNLKKSLTKKENKILIIETVKKVVLPVFLAALTTFFGFLSLLTVDIIPIKEFAILTGIGVMIEWILSLIFIPSTMMLLKVKKGSIIKQNINNKAIELPYFEKVLIKFIKFLKDKKIAITIILFALLVILLYGTSKLKIDFDVLKYFKKNSDIVKSTQFINKNFSGADTIYINIIGKEDGDLTKPEILDFMDKFGIFMIKKYNIIGKVVGFNDMIKKMNQVMHYPDSDEYKKFISTSLTYENFFEILKSANILTEKINPEPGDIVKALNKKYNVNGEDFYEIPLDPYKYDINENDISLYAKEKNLEYEFLSPEEKNNIKKEILSRLVSQYLVLYSGDMDQMIAQDQIKPKMTKLTMTLKGPSGEQLKEIKKDIIQYTKDYIPDGYTTEIGGSAMLSNEFNNIVVFGQISSFFISILIIFIIVAVSFRSFVAGFISIIPLTLSIICNFAIMGFFNLELNIATVLIASLTTGMGIDYAIHFLTFYKNNWKIYHDVDKAIEMTFLTSGKAIIYNAFSVGLGFAVLLLSSLIILGTFGILITLTMLTSAFGALTIIPILLEMFKPKFADK